MNRAAVFAHYDKNNIIQEYVIYYINKLKEVFSQIIFVSDSDLGREETKKLDNIANVVIAKRHGEYDFGSYKRGFLYLEENNLLQNIDELAFINDSCYGPLSDLRAVFDEMESRNSDFWGLAANYSSVRRNKQHVQSFFLVFNKNVFLSKGFHDFVCSVKEEKTKLDICIKYELGLTKLLEDNGYSWDVFSDISKIYCESYLYRLRALLLEDKFPLLKRSIVLKREAAFVSLKSVKKLVKKASDYPLELIEKDYEANKAENSFSKNIDRLFTFIKKFLMYLYWDTKFKFEKKKR